MINLDDLEKNIRDLEKKREKVLEEEKKLVLKGEAIEKEKSRLLELQKLAKKALENNNLDSLYGIFPIGEMEKVIADLATDIVGCKYNFGVNYKTKYVPYNSIKYREFDNLGYEILPTYQVGMAFVGKDLTQLEAVLADFRICEFGLVNDYDKDFNYLTLAKWVNSHFVSLVDNINAPYIKDFILYVVYYRKQNKLFDISEEELERLKREFLLQYKEKYAIHRIPTRVIEEEVDTTDYPIYQKTKCNLKDLGEVIASLVSEFNKADYYFEVKDFKVMDGQWKIGERADLKIGDKVYFKLAETSFKSEQRYVSLADNVLLYDIQKRFRVIGNKTLQFIEGFLGYVRRAALDSNITYVARKDLETLRENYLEEFKKGNCYISYTKGVIMSYDIRRGERKLVLDRR